MGEDPAFTPPVAKEQNCKQLSQHPTRPSRLGLVYITRHDTTNINSLFNKICLDYYNP